MTPLLETRGLRMTRGDKVLFEDVSFTLAPSDVMTIEGPSGSGKSTLLRLLGAQLHADSGDIILDGVTLRSIPPRDARRRIALLFQEPLMFEGTVLRNVETGPRLRKEALSPDQASSLLASVGLTGFEGRDARSLSGGEKQRVALARALANDPRVLLADEPTSALDGDSATHVLDVLRAAATRGLGVIMVTHHSEHAARIATRRMQLSQGKLSLLVTA